MTEAGKIKSYTPKWYENNYKYSINYKTRNSSINYLEKLYGFFSCIKVRQQLNDSEWVKYKQHEKKDFRIGIINWYKL